MTVDERTALEIVAGRRLSDADYERAREAVNADPAAARALHELRANLLVPLVVMFQVLRLLEQLRP